MEKEQSKESLPYWFETEEWKDFSKLAHNNFGGKPKMETLEEAALSIIPNRSTTGWIDSFGATERIGFIKGAKWMQERMYSEEEVIVILTERCKHFGTSVSPFTKLLLKQDLEWFEQFKKK
jgi:hypothetical protein